MQRSVWNTKISGLLTGLAVSLFIHLFLFCSFFFSPFKPIYLGMGSVEVNVDVFYSKDSSNHRPENKIRAPIPQTAEQSQEKVKAQSQTEAQSRAQTEDQSTSVSGGQRVSRWPKILHEKKVNYPTQAKLKGLDGTVTLKITISDKGIPENIQILEGPGSGLNEAAIEAMKGFLFSPAYQGDVAIPVSIIYKYKFKIQAAN